MAPFGYLSAMMRPFNAALRIFEKTYVASDMILHQQDVKGSHVTRRAWLAELAALPRGSDARRAAFQEMHKALHAAGDGNAVDRLSTARVSAQVASRRDWAFPLCSSVDISRLSGEIRGELSEVEVPSFAIAE